MAVINRKKLVQDFPWSKLTASARALVDALERFTDVTGKGTPSWSGLMYYSGIVGKDTFSTARKQLIEAGIISMTKTWNILEKEGKRYPHATITYQITESILWDKRASSQAKQSNYRDSQSMNMGSMNSGKEGVTFLDVNKDRDVYKQPSAVNKNIPIREEVNRGRGNPTAVGVTMGSSFSRLIGRSEVGEGGNVPHYEWQVEAERLAKYVGITSPSKSWFKFFRESFANNRKFLLQRAASVMVDAPNVEDKEKYFFGLVYKFLKEA